MIAIDAKSGIWTKVHLISLTQDWNLFCSEDIKLLRLQTFMDRAFLSRAASESNLYEPCSRCRQISHHFT